MLRSTFIHLPGVGEKTERMWWRAGISTWMELLTVLNDGSWRCSETRRREWQRWLRESIAQLEARNAAFFASVLPAREQWRCYSEFGTRTIFLDIETTGCGNNDYVTMVGLFDGRHYHAYVYGEDLEKFEDALIGYDIVVTFYGSAFDLPFLRRQFPWVQLPPIHIDLCYLLRRLGYRGGLKSVEWQLGVRRAREIEGLSGWDAVQLWHRYWHDGDDEALQLLVEYNRADVMNLKPLLEFAYQRLYQQLWERVLQVVPSHK
ncbi:MAG TPA: exonuclease [Armatimonadetes bacterium]|nr:exonuclease [Armatimonadota bacterium]